MLMLYARIELTSARSVPLETSPNAAVIRNVEGNETIAGIEIGDVFLPWSCVLLAQRTKIEAKGEGLGVTPSQRQQQEAYEALRKGLEGVVISPPVAGKGRKGAK